MIITSAELSEGKLSAAHLAESVMHIRDAGYVVLEGALNSDLVKALRGEYMALFEELHSSGNTDRLQRSHSGNGHYQIQPPLRGIFKSTELVANPLAMHCMREILGNDLRILYYNSNLARPGSDAQRIHRDNAHLFDGEMSVPTPPFSLVVNVLLSDFTSETGSTEVWPGSHLVMDSHWAEESEFPVEARAEALSSRRLNAPAGSLVIRDVRMWHRGMPNNSSQTRSMLSLVYKRNWLKWRYHESVTAPATTLEAWPAAVQELFGW